MRLSSLIGHNGEASGIDILGLSADSRKVKPGYLFAALAGVQARGSDFIASAIDQGAVAVLAEPDTQVDRSKAYLVTDANPRRRLARMAATFFGAQPETVVAVTGTNGKSSVAEFVRQLWEQAGLRAGAMGTLGVVATGIKTSPSLTTPDPIEIHERLAMLKNAGVDHLALEASSHGLAQYRLDGVRLKAAAFTNLTRDHLDYHESYDDYFLAKLRLFGELLPPGATAVLNTESHVYEELIDICWGRALKILPVGPGGALCVRDRERTSAGQRFEIGFGDNTYSLMLPLIGDFQASNALVAAGLVIATGGDPEKVIGQLAHLRPVRGRMERVGQLDNGAAVYVDYAHTPDALRVLLESLRPYTAGRLHVVFGCGGDRDRGKRPEMGSVAAELADRVVVTDDNPRGEDPAVIRQEILDAVPAATDMGDRRDAIHAAVAALEPGDILAVAGKGHEQGQVVGSKVLPFDDANVVREAIARRESAHA